MVSVALRSTDREIFFSDESDPNAKRRKTEEVNETLVRIPLNTGFVLRSLFSCPFSDLSLRLDGNV